MGNPWAEGSASLQENTTVFQANIYAIWACVYEIQNNVRSEKYISICPESQAALKSPQAAKTMSPLVQQCQKVLDDISTYYSVGPFWVPGHSGICGNEIANELTKEGSVHHFAGPDPALKVSRQSMGRKIQCWLHKQHMIRWQGLAGTLRWAQKSILSPALLPRPCHCPLTGRNTQQLLAFSVGITP
jgi:hypothetical protein